MKLFYRKIGTGQPLIVMHGLFGQGDNWNTLGKQFSEQGFEVYVVDLRNHGNSPHSDEWNYQVMSDDILELVNDLGMAQNKNIILLGHSMGGKVAMLFAIQHPELLDKLIVADIGPKYHVPDNDQVLKALNAIDLKTMNTRKEVEAALAEYIPDYGTKQFLLKNIYWKEDPNDSGVLDWKFNSKTLIGQMEHVREPIVADKPCKVATLFIRGARSTYILDEDIGPIEEMFPNSRLDTIAGAGHWVHADKPVEFFKSVITFIK